MLKLRFRFPSLFVLTMASWRPAAAYPQAVLILESHKIRTTSYVYGNSYPQHRLTIFSKVSSKCQLKVPTSQAIDKYNN